MTPLLKNAQRFDQRPGRVCTVGVVRWKWQLGKGGSVIAYSDTGLRKCAHAHTILGIDSYAWERAQCKRNPIPLTPTDIAQWLQP